jgi:glycosyltransferase involved in cell wall biosynthesis
MKKLKILYIIDYLSTGGGTEKQLRELIVNLDRERFIPMVVTLSKLDWHGLPAYHDPGCRHLCLEINRILSLKGLWSIIKLAKIIRRERFDIVQTYFVDANIIGVIAGFLGGCKGIIVSRRDMGYWYTPWILFVLRLLNRLAHYYVVNSDAVKNFVSAKEKVKLEKFKVIHNGFFNLPGDDHPETALTQLGIPVSTQLVGMVGNLRHVKRIDNFIRVAASIKGQDVHFLVLGIGHLKDDLMAQARDAGLNSRFIISHTLDNIYNYVKHFDVGVLTSDSEGLSNTLVEYQLCGVPAVAFDVGGNREVIEDGVTGFLLKHGDLDGMREKIELLLTNKELRATMGCAAARISQQKFAGDRMIKEYSDFYLEMQQAK